MYNLQAYQRGPGAGVCVAHDGRALEHADEVSSGVTLTRAQLGYVYAIAGR